MPFHIDPVGAVIGGFALGLFLWRNLRFLYQGYWFRQQSNERKSALIHAHRDWGEYHARDLPKLQVVLLCVIALIVIIGCILANSGWLFFK
jgi:ABC-type uncharacterized transport system permease subunit